MNARSGLRAHLPPLAVAGGIALAAAILAAPAAAQTPDPVAAAPKTRAEVRKETEDFLKTHRWSEAQGQWLPEDKPPAGAALTRAEVREQLHEFLRNHRWDDQRTRWVPLKPQRRLSTLTREQVRAETAAFLRTHHWDDATSSWLLNTPPAPPAKR